MKKPAHVIEIFLQPGDFYFGDRDTRIRTILGSCVAITIWHPSMLIGGMCHFVLPTRHKEKPAALMERLTIRPIEHITFAKPLALDGRYADEAMEMFMREIRASKTRPDEYHIKLFGGGNMFPAIKKDGGNCTKQSCSPMASDCRNVSCRNELTAQQMVKQYGFNIQAASLGGAGSRQIFFDIWTGHVWSRHNPIVKPANMIEAA